MRYQGGKTRAAKHIIAVMKELGVSGPYWEPFCGGLGISTALVRAFGPGLHSDVNAALITLYRAVRVGWVPPEEVSEAEYAAARHLSDSNPLKAFCAVAGSFGGKWFGGYGRDNVNLFAMGRRSLLRDVPMLDQVLCMSFFDIEPCEGLGFIYCDPPYAGTRGYAGAPPFDHAAFWHRAAAWSDFCPVFVSEYAAPEGWTCVWERQQQTQIARVKRKLATERLFARGKECV